MAEELKTYESTQKGLTFRVQMTASTAKELGLREVRETPEAPRSKPGPKPKESK